MHKEKKCFISLVNLYLCPYISKYISLLESDYDVICWDRHGIEENAGESQMFAFHYKMDEGSSKLSKLIGYLKFRRYALKIIRKNNYSGIILLQTSVGILLSKFLKRNYSGKYIIDIRDYTMENNPVFFNIEKGLIKNSLYAVISSRGYENFLPKHNYTLVHNDINIDDITMEKFRKKKRSKDKIVISYIGLIRFHDQNKKFILKFKDDKRFILRFIGKDAYALKEFCKDNNINNVELIDRFPPEKTLHYYYDTDIIYNLYGNNTPLLDYALSNKLYYAAKLKMPILVCLDTYMEKVSSEYGFGYSFNIDNEEECNNLFYYYNSIKWNEFNDNCDKFIDEVNKSNELFIDAVKTFDNKINI